MTLIKICGLMREEDVDASQRADFQGFVVASGSRRSLMTERARELMSSARGSTVLVSSTSDLTLLARLALYLRPNVVQAHYPFSPSELSALAEAVPVDVWALVPMGTGSEMTRARSLLPAASALVLDTAAGLPGGNGVPHDWNLSRTVRDACHPCPVVLAGGLSPSNVEEGISRVRPFVVDVSSGVESGGRKDPKRIRDFISKVQGAAP